MSDEKSEIESATDGFYLTDAARVWARRGDALYRRALEGLDTGAMDVATVCRIVTESRGCAKLAIAWEQARTTEEMAALKARLDARESAADVAESLQ